jgi:hypothetical protein
MNITYFPPNFLYLVPFSFRSSHDSILGVSFFGILGDSFFVIGIVSRGLKKIFSEVG